MLSSLPARALSLAVALCAIVALPTAAAQASRIAAEFRADAHTSAFSARRPT